MSGRPSRSAIQLWPPSDIDVEATPMGTYQAIVYRAIGEQWYRQCDLNRDLIVTGTVRIRI